MKSKMIIAGAKFVAAVAVGIIVGAATRPCVEEFFKLNKKEPVDPTPSEDCTEEEVFAEEN